MALKKVVTGNYAAAYAAMRARVKTVAAYPITPQTFIVEHLSEFINNGELDCAYMEVESEHSAMSACVSASATGVRTFTATSSQGLALMHEILPIASGLRLPVVMAVEQDHCRSHQHMGGAQRHHARARFRLDTGVLRQQPRGS